MVYFTKHIFMFIAVDFILFSSFTLATWLYEPFGVCPPFPSRNERLTCHGWLMYYDFGEYAANNRELARNRDKQHDDTVDIYSVIYAHVLLAFPGHEYTPSKYCNHQVGHEVSGPFVQLISSRLQCASWIHHYGYKFDENNRNRKYAKSRDKNEDVNISAWATGYARFIERKIQKLRPISIDAYCFGLGLDLRLLEFISLNGTRKTCKQWINLSGYGDETNIDNLDRARTQDKKFMKYINVFTKLYIEYLKSYTPKRNICCISSMGVHDDMPETPENFCETRGYGEVLRPYYDNYLSH